MEWKSNEHIKLARRERKQNGEAGVCAMPGYLIPALPVIIWKVSTSKGRGWKERPRISALGAALQTAFSKDI